ATETDSDDRASGASSARVLRQSESNFRAGWGAGRAGSRRKPSDTDDRAAYPRRRREPCVNIKTPTANRNVLLPAILSTANTGCASSGGGTNATTIEATVASAPVTATMTSTGRPPQILLSPFTGGPADSLMAAPKSSMKGSSDATTIISMSTL